MLKNHKVTSAFSGLGAMLTGVSALAITATTPAMAQGAAAGGLDEITVTAQRREENQQDVPISVTTLPADRLANILQGAEDIRALATRVPGLYAESSNGRVAPRFYIRGLGNTDFDLAASQPVEIVMDDIVMENVVLKSFPLFDIASVEVLRGPQGTLFGRNTPAGIIKFDTAKPSDELNGYLSGSYGRFSTAKVEGAVGGPLSESLAYRASFLYQRRNDWIDNGGVIQNGFNSIKNAYGGFEDIAGRLQLQWNPSDNFEVLLNGHGRHIDGTAELFRANIFTAGSNDLNSNFVRDVVWYDEGGGNKQQYSTYGGSARVTIDLGGASIISITGFETANGSSRGDIDGGSGAAFLPNGSFPGFIPFNSDTRDGIDDLDQFTQEVRLASNGNNLFDWQLGFFYFDSKLIITTNPFFAPATTVRHDNDSWSFFGQGSYDLSDRITFTGGVRYTKDNKDFTGVATNFPVMPISLSDGKVSWDAALTYRLTDNINVYGRIARGFRAPTIQGRDVAFFGAPTTATSETILSYEGGFKSELFNRRMRLNATGFYYDAKDLQFSAIGGLGNFNQLVNADGRAYGFEADLEWLPADNFLLTGGVSYNNTEITEPGLTVGACGGGCTITDPLDMLGNAIVTGNPFPQAPDWTWNVTARYAIATNSGEFYLSTDWAGQGRTNFFLYESAEFYSSGNVEGGARLGLLCKDGNLDVALFVRNILDAENVKGAIDFNNLTGFVNEPRIYGVSATMKF